MAQQQYITSDQAESAVTKSGEQASKQPGLRVVGVELPQTQGGGTINPVKPLVQDTSVESFNNYMAAEQATKNLYDQWGREMDKVADTKMRATSLLGDNYLKTNGLQDAIVNAGAKFEAQKRQADAEAKKVKDETDTLNSRVAVDDYMTQIENAPDKTTLDIGMRNAKDFLLKYGKDNNVNPLIINNVLNQLHDDWQYQERKYVNAAIQNAEQISGLNANVAAKEITNTFASPLARLKDPNISPDEVKQTFGLLVGAIDARVAAGDMSQVDGLRLRVSLIGAAYDSATAGSAGKVEMQRQYQQTLDWQAAATQILNDPNLPDSSKGDALYLKAIELGVNPNTPTAEGANLAHLQLMDNQTKIAQGLAQNKTDPQAVAKLTQFRVLGWVNAAYTKGPAQALAELEANKDVPGYAQAKVIIQAIQTNGAKVTTLQTALQANQAQMTLLQSQATKLAAGDISMLKVGEDPAVRKTEMETQYVKLQGEELKLKTELGLAQKDIPDAYNSGQKVQQQLKEMQPFMDRLNVVPVPQSGF